MTKRLDGAPRSDKGTTRKYSSVAERDSIRSAQKRRAQARYRERHKEALRESSLAYRAANKAECSRRSREWQLANPDKHKNAVLMRKYGISIEQYRALSTAQDDRCAICSRKARLVVDHCHASGEVRGLLCDPCNAGLGLFKDRPDHLAAAIEYIAGYAKLVGDRLKGDAK